MLKKQLAQQSVSLGEPLSGKSIGGWSPLWFHLLLLLSSSLDSPVVVNQASPEVESAAATIADLQRRNAELEQKLCDAECQLSQLQLSQFQSPQDATVGAVADVAIADQVSAVDDLVLIRDAQGRCTRILTPQSRHLGLFPGGMLGETLHKTFSNEVANHLWNAMWRALQTQTTVQAGFYLRQGDQVAWFDARISPLGHQAGLWVVRDVTAYKQMEIAYCRTQVTVESLNHLNQQLEEWVRMQAEELAQTQSTLRLSEEQMRLALVAAKMGVWSADLRTGEEVWSAESEALFGFAPGEFDGTYASFIGCIHPHDRDLVAQQLDQACITGDYQVDYRVVWPDQTLRWIATRGRVRYDAQGQPSSLNGIDLDITDRKRAEQRLQASVQEKDVLLKEIHHRVKNNLQIISSLLRMQSRHVEDAQTRSLLQDLQNRVQAMALIHEQLYRSPNLSKVDFKQYVEPLVNHLFRAYGVSRQEIQVEIRAQEISLTLDYAIPCGLIINELISNSLKYAFPACARSLDPLVVRRIQIELQAIAAEADGKSQWALTVQDNGIGFEPNFQGEHISTLGLRIVHNLVDQLNGTIQQLPIAGTCFRILFRTTS